MKGAICQLSRPASHLEPRLEMVLKVGRLVHLKARRAEARVGTYGPRSSQRAAEGINAPIGAGSGGLLGKRETFKEASSMQRGHVQGRRAWAVERRALEGFFGSKGQASQGRGACSSRRSQ